ncbi:MAG: GMC family oxidoreductase [Pseudomonadota bacterium]
MSNAVTFEADVAIVGSGVGGALIAEGLARSGLKVLVLEAGVRFTRDEILSRQRSIWQQDNSSLYPDTDLAPRASPSSVNRYEIVNHGPIEFGSYYLRGVGGTTWHWQAVCLRMSLSDQRIRTQYGVGYDWPLAYSEMQHYYDVAEIELGVSGDNRSPFGKHRENSFPMAAVAPSYADILIQNEMSGSGIEFFSRPTARNSQPYDGRPACQGHHNCSNMCPIGAQYAAIVHVEKAEKHGARFLSEALVTELKTDGDSKIASLYGKRADGSRFSVKAKAYVIAANPVESVRLMLGSASSEYPQGIGNSSGAVGRRLMDHYNIGWRMDAARPVYAGRGPLTAFATDALLDGDFRKHQASSLVGFENIDLTSEVATEALRKFPLDAPAVDAEIRRLLSRRLVLTASIEQLPVDENRIWVDFAKRDKNGLPQINAHYSLGAYSQAGRSASRKLFDQIATRLNAKMVSEGAPFYAVHTSGTLMMGDDPSSFVCDPYGRTHDHENLFVAGSSLFPSISAVNPTLTIAALALRTKDRIKQTLRA